MYNYFIQLKTPEPLTLDETQSWFETVRNYGPDDITSTYSHNDSEISMEYGTCDDCENPHTYVIPLRKHLSNDETLFIVQAWEYTYPGDFDIEISNDYSSISDDTELHIDEDVKHRAAGDLNKLTHNRWVSSQISEGWRWGTHYNSREKTHPALRSWDDLPESHRRSRDISNKEIFEWLKFHKLI